MHLARLLAFALVFPVPSGISAQNRPPTQAPTSLQARLSAAPKLNLEATELPLKLPKDQQLGMISWLDRDSKNGNLWLIQRGPHCPPILAIDPGTGRVLHAFGQGSFRIPHSIRVAPDGSIWTVDAGTSQVIKWTQQGEKLFTINLTPPSNSAQTQNAFAGATDIAFTASGHLLITDGYRNARVLEYSPTGKLIHQWGTPGSRPGQFNLPHALVLDSTGTVYVADRENARVQTFTAEGKFLAEFDDLGRIYDLALGPGNTLWASTSPLTDPPGSPGWILQLDRTSGKLLGYVPVPQKPALHTVTTDMQGHPLTDVGNTILWFRAPR